MMDVYLRPRMILDRFSKLYPNAWKQVDDLRANRNSLGDRPDWCFLPLAGAYAIVSDGAMIEDPDTLKHVALLGALAAWRVTQGIYRFDPSTFDAIWKTPVTGDIPSAVLHHLPEWCVYVPTPGQTWKGTTLYGFFAHLEYDANDRRTDLRFVLDVSATPGEQMLIMPIHVGKGGVANAVEEVLEESLRHVRVSIVPSDSEVLMLKRDMPPLVSLVLYLCCEAAEISGGHGGRRAPARPKPVRTKTGMRIFPPDRPNQWEVGYRLGAALRSALSEHDSGQTTGSHASPRPHVRRAHWHSFWVGKWNEPEARAVILRWLPPIPVNVQSVEELVTTIRGVSDD